MTTDDTGGPGRDDIRALLDLASERDLTELEARRLETAIAETPELAAELLEDPALDRIAHGSPVPLPDDAEWERIDRGIEAATGTGEDAPAADLSSALPGPGSARRAPAWRIVVPLAAATVLCALVVRQIVQEGLGEPAGAPPIAEVLDLPENSETFILTPEEEDGGVMIFVTSS